MKFSDYYYFWFVMLPFFVFAFYFNWGLEIIPIFLLILSYSMWLKLYNNVA